MTNASEDAAAPNGSSRGEAPNLIEINEQEESLSKLKLVIDDLAKVKDNESASGGAGRSNPFDRSPKNHTKLPATNSRGEGAVPPGYSTKPEEPPKRNADQLNLPGRNHIDSDFASSSNISRVSSVGDLPNLTGNTARDGNL